MNNSGGPRISIIMPCCNGDKYLEKALAAFFSQSYVQKRLIIVDGKSTDNSHNIISKFIELGMPLIWDRTPDAGISNAINIGIQHLLPDEVFGYLGCDDILMPDVLGEIGRIFHLAESIDGLFFDSFSYFPDVRSLIYRACPTSEFSFKNLLKFGTISGLQNVFIRSNHVIAYKFSDSHKYSMDYDLYLRIARDGIDRFTHIKKPSTINIMDGNISTGFALCGASEALKSAVDIAGWTPRLLYKYFLLRASMFKRWGRYLWH